MYLPLISTVPLPKLNTFITGEWAWIKVNVPSTFTQQYGNKQQGGFMDIVQPVLKKKILAGKKQHSTLPAGLNMWIGMLESLPAQAEILQKICGVLCRQSVSGQLHKLYCG